jgi:polyisoprenoid-binding protein YceI
MKQRIVLIATILGLFIVACNQSPKEKTAVKSTAISLDVADADTLIASQNTSKIIWKGFKPGGEHTGFVNLKSNGVVLVKDNQLVGGNFIIDLTSITDTDLSDPEMNGKLIGHLKSADFFNVDSFPEARFVLSGVSKVEGDNQYAYLLSGDLTIKNITKPISFKTNLEIDGHTFSAESEPFMLDRTQWNVNYGSKSIFKELTDKFINDEFSIQISLKSI